MNTLNRLKDLITYKTITSSKELLSQEIDSLQDFFLSHKMVVNIHDRNGFKSLVATSKKTKHPKILLVCHIDVVPGGDSLFEPRISGDKLIGRGAFDMKFALATYMTTIQNLSEDISTYDFGVMISTDEEIGGNDGVGFLLNDCGYSCDIALLPDGSNHWDIESNAKGVWHINLISVGTNAHAAYPWDGKNAYLQLHHAIDEIVKQFNPAPIESSYEPTINIGSVISSGVHNQIPNKAEAKIDIRFVNEPNFIQIKKKTEEIVSRHKGVKLNSVLKADSFELDKDNPFLESFVNIVKMNTNLKKINYIKSQGGSDARFFSKNNIPCIVTRPNGGGPHSENEWININDLDVFTAIVTDFVKSV
ncbi:MAG: M20/M25/M40 family metallo-hydrolase [bacterium]|nr:M20/M25/M40 family metallo-hydrolase [bacterium]